MHPSFEQFISALRNPAERAGIRLVIDDASAAALLGRADWATDYYQRWIALFPAVEVAAAAPVPAPTPVHAPAASPYGPPPTAASTAAPAAYVSSAFSRDPALAQTAAAHSTVDPWIANGFDGPPRERSRARVAIIALASLVGVLALVIGGIAVAGAVNPSARTATSTSTLTPGSGAQPAAGADQVFFHGLTKREYDLLEATTASTGTSLERAVATGTTDAFLRAMADELDAKTETACQKAAGVPQGFDNATLHASFRAGYENTTHCTDAQADAVYAAIIEYCRD